jgi:hypothetical protein
MTTTGFGFGLERTPSLTAVFLGEETSPTTRLAKNPAGPQHANDADHDPEYVQKNIGRVFFKRGTPGKNHGVGRVKRPDKQERTLGSKPADQAETEYPHHHANYFDDLDASKNELIYSI